jgi:hypothetical protein
MLLLSSSKMKMLDKKRYKHSLFETLFNSEVYQLRAAICPGLAKQAADIFLDVGVLPVRRLPVTVILTSIFLCRCLVLLGQAMFKSIAYQLRAAICPGFAK